jgi:hypothetical protein
LKIIENKKTFNLNTTKNISNKSAFIRVFALVNPFNQRPKKHNNELYIHTKHRFTRQMGETSVKNQKESA